MCQWTVRPISHQHNISNINSSNQITTFSVITSPFHRLHPLTLHFGCAMWISFLSELCLLASPYEIMLPKYFCKRHNIVYGYLLAKPHIILPLICMCACGGFRAFHHTNKQKFISPYLNSIRMKKSKSSEGMQRMDGTIRSAKNTA